MTSIQGSRDHAVYRWEWSVLEPLDRRPLTEPEARGIVNHVWAQRGLRNPPRISLDDRMSGATGTRLEIKLGSCRNTITVLHELAHSMDQSVEAAMGFYKDRPKGESITGSTHDENWLGLYMNLLSDFMGPSFNKLYLMKTLHDAGLTYELCPKVRC